MYNEFEVGIAEAFFVPLNLSELYDEAVKEFGKILSKNLKEVQGHDRIPKDIAAEIKDMILDYLQEELYDEEELANLLAKKLHAAGVPNATYVAEITISEFVEKLKRLLKKAEEKVKKKKKETTLE